MGLFGGFKGKLIGKTKKNKKEKESHVVCVKFNTFSEFDSPSSSAIPSSSNSNLGRLEVVREKRPVMKPEVMNIFGGPANGDVRKPAPISNVRKKELPPIPTELTPLVLTPVKSKASVPIPMEPTTPLKSKVPASVPTPPVVTPVKSKVPVPIPMEPTPPVVTPVKTKAPAPTPIQPEPPKTKTQAPRAPIPVPRKEPEVKPPSPEIVTKTIQFPLPSDSDDDDEGNFKIHFSGAANHNFGDLSDDESEGDDPPDFSFGNYSSQATSIFFGGQEEPVMRPRNIAFNDDGGDSDGSSASA